MSATLNPGPVVPSQRNTSSRRRSSPGELHNHLKPRKKGQQTALAAEELPTFLHALEIYQGDAATLIQNTPIRRRKPPDDCPPASVRWRAVLFYVGNY